MRLLAGVGFGVIWAIVPLVAPLYVSRYPNDEGLAAIPVCLVSLVIIALTRPLWRDTTRLNRQLVATFAYALAVQPLYVLTLKYGVHAPSSATVIALMGYWSLVMGFMAVAIERRLAPLPIAYALALFAALRFPEDRYMAATFANVVTVVTVAIIWSRRGTEIAIERDARRRERGRVCL